MRHVLLLNSDKQGPVKVLEQLPDVKYTVMTTQALQRFYLPGQILAVNDLGEIGDVLHAARACFARTDVTDVVAATEKAVPSAAFLRSYFGLPGMPYDQALRFSNKIAMKRALSSHVAVTPFAAARTPDDVPGRAAELGWPVVVKPAFGAGSEDTVAVHSEAHFRLLLRAGAFDQLRTRRMPLIVERFVNIVNEYHCDGVVRDGRVLFASASRYFAPPLSVVGDFHGGVHLPREDPVAVALVETHAAVVAALNLRDGVTHLEVFETEAGLVVGEIACRPGGGGISTSLKHAYGVDLWREHVLAALALPTDLRETEISLSPGVYGYCGLPAKAGRIVTLSTTGELEAVSGVYAVSMRYKVGDALPARTSSVFFTGEVFFRLDGAAETEAFLRRLRYRYACETEGPGVASGGAPCTS